MSATMSTSMLATISATTISSRLRASEMLTEWKSESMTNQTTNGPGAVLEMLTQYLEDAQAGVSFGFKSLV